MLMSIFNLGWGLLNLLQISALKRKTYNLILQMLSLRACKLKMKVTSSKDSKIWV